ncbi:hypothetical protein U1Q18_036451 [Sarracenia purpurea var. burkii]
MLGSYAVWCFSVKALWLVCKRVVRIWWRDPGPNGGDFDAFGVEAIDEEIEDEEEDDGITPVSDKDGTESELLTQKSLVRLTRNIHTGFGKVACKLEKTSLAHAPCECGSRLLGALEAVRFAA